MTRIADRAGEWLRSVGQPWEIVCFAWLPASVTTFAFWYLIRAHAAQGDFPIFRTASKAVLHGRSPYVGSVNTAALAHFDKFVYPPAAAFLFSPLAVVPYDVGKALLFVLGIAATLAALRVLGVRDWRCYGLAVASAPVVDSVALGALTSFLLLGTALTWRYRDSPALAGTAASVTAVVKLFLWPLGVWLVVTRRARAASVFAVVAVLTALIGWAAIGFAGIGAYPHLLRALSQVEAGVSYSPIALLRLSGSGATAVSVALVAAVVLAVALSARRPDGERRSFAIAVLGALLATPVLWLHYFALLFVPIALYRPRLSGLWFVPLALWLTPAGHSEGSLWKIALALAVAIIVAIRTIGVTGVRLSGFRPFVAQNQR